VQPTQPRLFPKETTVTDRTENDAIIEHIAANLAPRVQEVTRGTSDLAQVLVVPKSMQTLRVKELLDACPRSARPGDGPPAGKAGAPVRPWQKRQTHVANNCARELEALCMLAGQLPANTDAYVMSLHAWARGNVSGAHLARFWPSREALSNSSPEVHALLMALRNAKADTSDHPTHWPRHRRAIARCIANLRGDVAEVIEREAQTLGRKALLREVTP
jgi:hypothetical protein